jgi:PAS domain-containing protein
MTDMIHPGDVEKVWSVFAEIASRPGVSPRVEVRARHRDGSWRHIEAVANNFLHDPNLRGIVVNSRDVTERRRAEEEIRQLNEDLERRVAERTSELEATIMDLERRAERAAQG